MLGFSFRILYLSFFLCLAWAAAEIDKQWTESSRYKKTVLRKKRAALTDFQRFKVKLLKRQVSHNYNLNILYELAGGVFSGRQKLPVFVSSSFIQWLSSCNFMSKLQIINIPRSIKNFSFFTMYKFQSCYRGRGS